MMDPGEEESRNPLEGPAMRLALAGFVPFAALIVWLVAISNDHVWRDETIFLLKVYSATILSFLGGTRFGEALMAGGEEQRLPLAASVVPALCAWVACSIGEPASFALLAVAFAAQGAWDSVSSHRGDMPGWYGRMRVVVTGIYRASPVRPNSYQRTTHAIYRTCTPYGLSYSLLVQLCCVEARARNAEAEAEAET